MKCVVLQMTEELDDVAPPIPQEVFGERTEAFLKELEDYKAKVGVTVIAENDSLLGNHRVAIDGIISEEQCRQLVQLASVGKSCFSEFVCVQGFD